MSEKKKDSIESLGFDEALVDLKFLAQKVSDMSKDLAKKAVDNAEGVTDKVGDLVDSTGDALITAGLADLFELSFVGCFKNVFIDFFIKRVYFNFI